jgi:hypothetical protein
MKPRQVIREDPMVARFMSMCPKEVVVYRRPFVKGFDMTSGIIKADYRGDVVAKVRFASVKGRTIRAWLIGPEKEDRAKFSIYRNAAVSAAYRGVGEVSDVLFSAAIDAATEIRKNYEVWEHFE